MVVCIRAGIDCFSLAAFESRRYGMHIAASTASLIIPTFLPLSNHALRQEVEPGHISICYLLSVVMTCKIVHNVSIPSPPPNTSNRKMYSLHTYMKKYRYYVYNYFIILYNSVYICIIYYTVYVQYCFYIYE